MKQEIKDYIDREIHELREGAINYTDAMLVKCGVKKVYCNDCEYYKYIEGTDGLRECNFYDNVKEIDTPTRKEKVFIKKAEELNKDNHCKNYWKTSV